MPAVARRVSRDKALRTTPSSQVLPPLAGIARRLPYEASTTRVLATAQGGVTVLNIDTCSPPTPLARCGDHDDAGNREQWWAAERKLFLWIDSALVRKGCYTLTPAYYDPSIFALH